MEMREMIDNVSSIMEGNIGTYYHGSTHNISSFVDDFVGAGNDQYGPGIYFSNRLYIAVGYTGYPKTGNVYECTLNFRNELSKKTKYNAGQIMKLISSTPDEDAYSNWDEDPERGKQNAIRSYLDSYGRDMFEIFMQIWYDWYRYNAPEFVRMLVSFGYDGTVHELGNGTQFVVVYNPASITLIKSTPAKDIDLKDAQAPE